LIKDAEIKNKLSLDGANYKRIDGILGTENLFLT
jgi:hypothetical protein